jgi:hypothetical protein
MQSRQSLMRRFRTCIFALGLSAVLSVLVAWACILWLPYQRHTSPPREPLIDGYPALVAGPHGLKDWWFTSDGFGVRQAVPSGARGGNGHFLYWRGSHTPAFYQGGWPMLSMQSVVRFQEGANGRYLSRWQLTAAEIFHRGLQTSDLPAWLHAKRERRLPLVPLWPGFAIDTLLYFGTLLGCRYLWFRMRKAPASSRGAKSIPAPGRRNVYSIGHTK